MSRKRTDRTYEQAYAELTAVVEKLQGGDLPLEETITLFEKGVALSRECEKFLDDAGRRIEVLMQDSEGNVAVEELEDLDD